ncbi:MAG: hypothetical protein LBT05_09635 [Planctomycetaceae bacterium]|jgi:hypothetical protein|nr:hypothetical protein [Planctomycetaceae bacterium]
MFRRNIASVIADLPVDGWKWEKPLNRCDLSAKGRLPDVYLLTKIPLIYYSLLTQVKFLKNLSSKASQQSNPINFLCGISEF